MHQVITPKMKDEFLKALKGYYDKTGTKVPIKEFEFTLATKWYADNFPMLRYGLPSNQDYQVELMDHLASEGMLKVNPKKGITFWLTEKGCDRLTNLMSTNHIGDSNPIKQPNKNKEQWHTKPLGVVILSLISAIIFYLIIQPYIPSY